MAPRAADALLTDLADAIHGVSSPFACGGSLVLKAPLKLMFASGERFTVAPAEREFEQEAANEPLRKLCAPARFGKGRKTRYDRAVREALQLDAAGGAFRVEGFDPNGAGLLKQIRAELAPSSTAITAELYSLNVYGKDGHFKPHKDTPRGPDMIGTLVVCLPSRFYNGHLVVAHRGAVRVFDWDAQIRADPNPKTIYWAAFFGDVDHAIERVWWGSRVTVTYLLRAEPAAIAVAQSAGEAMVAERFRAVLSSRLFTPKGGVLAFPCFHMYSQDRDWKDRATSVDVRSVTRLKGRDQIVARAALELGLDVSLHPYLIEICADETWPLERFPTDRERDALANRLDPWKLERSLPLAGEGSTDRDPRLTWVEPPPHFNGSPHLYRTGFDGGRGPLFPELPALEYLHGCEYSSTGYFGNEGSDTEFYVYSALHVTIPPSNAPARFDRDEATRKPRRRRSAG